MYCTRYKLTKDKATPYTQLSSKKTMIHNVLLVLWYLDQLKISTIKSIYPHYEVGFKGNVLSGFYFSLGTDGKLFILVLDQAPASRRFLAGRGEKKEKWVRFYVYFFIYLHILTNNQYYSIIFSNKCLPLFKNIFP